MSRWPDGRTAVSRRFEIPVRVYYEDTDAGGVVYYANYLRFMERCRSDWLRDLGYDIRSLTEQYGVIFAVRSARIDYLKPARLSDILTINVNLIGLKRVSLEVSHDIRRDNQPVCRGSMRLASLDTNTFEPKPIPEPLIVDIKKWKMP